MGSDIDFFKTLLYIFENVYSVFFISFGYTFCENNNIKSYWPGYFWL